MAEENEQSEYVTLISNDDFEFVITRSAACVSSTLKKMFDTSRQYYPSYVC